MGDAILTAIGGYAIGTLQVLAVDWFRARRRHAQQLRLLRAELRRARVRRAKFQWVRGQPPKSDLVPEPPGVSDVFTSTVADTDFRLTDEFEGDNTQEALLGLLDGFDQLRRYRDDTLSSTDSAKGTTDKAEARKYMDRACALADRYDEVLDMVHFQIDSALEDIGRRLRVSALRRQLFRTWSRLPAGTPPASLKPGDPRLDEWRRNQS